MDEQQPIDEKQPSRVMSILTMPIIALLATLHFCLCVSLMVFFRTEKRRREIYEYYAPWGWGEIKGDEQ